MFVFSLSSVHLDKPCCGTPIKPDWCFLCLILYLELSLVLKVKVKVAKLCLTLLDPMDYTVHETLQARILEWVAVPFSRGSSQPRYQSHVSHIAGGFLTSWATIPRACFPWLSTCKGTDFCGLSTEAANPQTGDPRHKGCPHRFHLTIASSHEVI